MDLLRALFCERCATLPFNPRPDCRDCRRQLPATSPDAAFWDLLPANITHVTDANGVTIHHRPTPFRAGDVMRIAT